MNSVNLIGRITKDVELRTTASGKSVVAFTLAVDRFTKEAGADFINCVAWEQTAQNMYKFVKKGDPLGVSGRLSQRVYEDKSGKKVSAYEVIANEVKFLQTRQAAAPQTDFVEIKDDEDLPF